MQKYRVSNIFAKFQRVNEKPNYIDIRICEEQDENSKQRKRMNEVGSKMQEKIGFSFHLSRLHITSNVTRRNSSEDYSGTFMNILQLKRFVVVCIVGA